MAARVVVVGLGPAGADLIVPAARRALEHSTNRYVRTARHPAVEELAAAGIELRSFDEEYDAAADVDEVYTRIAAKLVDVAADTGEVVYAVPGNPAVAERSVALLRKSAESGNIKLEIVPGLSFAELAWSRLGIDPMSGARVADARRLTAEAAVGEGPLLIAQCDTRLVLSDVKLVLLEVLPADAAVTVLRHLGLPDEHIRTVALADLDREVEPDHVTALLVDSGAGAAAREVARLLRLAERLRGPGGCPWDAEQTHHSLTRYLLEEAYEVVETVEALPPDAPAGDVPADAYRALEDELGDLLYQVIFHAILAEEAGAFDMGDVARGIHDKLVRRHPHVFGETDADTVSDVMRNWEQIKKDEKGHTSIVSGITPGLPSLLYAHKLMRKAASVGLDPGGREDALRRLDAVLADLRSDQGRDLEAQLGDLLAAAIVLARSGGVDAESALRGWAVRFRRRFEAVERLAEERHLELATLPPDKVAALWIESGEDR
ncbi:MAG: nucleoside triphosphate pyrophosphohydrolase [Actinomycetota bacterium]|nr:nucleoside triphosphate pyrophosphohydrolase [Actinomycetota bacterium]